MVGNNASQAEVHIQFTRGHEDDLDVAKKGEGEVCQDDDCLICYQTLYRPYQTACGHAACGSCLLQWATAAMTVRADTLAMITDFDVDGLRFSCPTCRTSTTASLNVDKDNVLSRRYPGEYARRRQEETENEDLEKEGLEDGVQNIKLLLGNSHTNIETSPNTVMNRTQKHEWTFFVQSSLPLVIDTVEVILHPSFKENRLITMTKPPFALTRRGEFPFGIWCGLTLRDGYTWIDNENVIDSDSTTGRVQDKLPISWTLDFNGNGRQEIQKHKIKKTREVVSTHSRSQIAKNHGNEQDDDDLASLVNVVSEREIKQLRRQRAKAGNKSELR